MERYSYPRRLWRAFVRIFSWGWNAMATTLTVCGLALFVNGLLYAGKAGGLAPAQLAAAMSWLMTPMLTVLDAALPSLAWLVRLSASLWDLSSLIELTAIFSGLLGMACGTVLFIRELFRFH